MDRIAQIMLCAERTKINKYIEEHGKINCVLLKSPRMSENTCRLNCARAYITKKTIKARSGNPVWMKTNWIVSCLDCPRYKIPSKKEMAEVIVENQVTFRRKNGNKEKRDMARASSLERNMARLYNKVDTIPPLDSSQNTTIEADPGEHGENPQSTDIFDVGIRIETNEDE